MNDASSSKLNVSAPTSRSASPGSLPVPRRSVAAASPSSAGRSRHVRSVYQRVAGRYDRDYRRAWLAVAGGAAENAMLAQVIAHLSDRTSPRVLDAGAGTGALSRELAEVLPAVRPVLVDLSPAMLAEAAGLHAPRAIANLAALPFANAQFDVVMSAWVIETVDDPRAVITELLRVLRPDGQLIYSFCTRPGRRRDRWRTAPLRAVVHALFAGHFLTEAQIPFHDCDRSSRITFAGGAVTVVSLGTCCTVGRELPPSGANVEPGSAEAAAVTLSPNRRGELYGRSQSPRDRSDNRAGDPAA